MNLFTRRTFAIVIILISSLISKTVTAQNISYYEDSNESATFSNIESFTFKPYIKAINAGVNSVNYWFKIEGFTEPKHTIQFINAHIAKAEAIQGNNYILAKSHERFVTFETRNIETVYIKVYTNRESFIPIIVSTSTNFDYNEKKQNLIMGIYYGFTIGILFLNLFYFFNFRDITFLYYSFFLFTITFGLLISDGILRFFEFPSSTIDFIETNVHFLVAVSGVLFATSFLQIDDYYPKLKYICFGLVFIIGILSIGYVSTSNFNYYVILELLVFTIFTIYIVTAMLLFKKNDFFKIFLIAYIFILILGVLYYVNKLLGITVLNISASVLKIGGIIEMMILSFAVIYRMKALHIENNNMRSALNRYTNEIDTLQATINKNDNANSNITTESAILSFRENEILQLISLGKTNKEIAVALNISGNTVKYHVKNIYTKLNIKSRKEVLQLSTV